MTEPRYILSSRAAQHIAEMLTSIAAKNPKTAAQLVHDLENAFDQIGRWPHLGRARPDLTSAPLKFWTIERRYIVAYEPHNRPVLILGIFHGARDWPTLL